MNAVQQALEAQKQSSSDGPVNDKSLVNAGGDVGLGTTVPTLRNTPINVSQAGAAGDPANVVPAAPTAVPPPSPLPELPSGTNLIKPAPPAASNSATRYTAVPTIVLAAGLALAAVF